MNHSHLIYAPNRSSTTEKVAFRPRIIISFTGIGSACSSTIGETDTATYQLSSTISDFATSPRSRWPTQPTTPVEHRVLTRRTVCPSRSEWEPLTPRFLTGPEIRRPSASHPRRCPLRSTIVDPQVDVRQCSSSSRNRLRGEGS